MLGDKNNCLFIHLFISQCLVFLFEKSNKKALEQLQRKKKINTTATVHFVGGLTMRCERGALATIKFQLLFSSVED